MARCAISREHADALRQLAKDLNETTQEIEESGETLRSTVSGLGGALGIYETLILDLISQVKRAQAPRTPRRLLSRNKPRKSTL